MDAPSLRKRIRNGTLVMLALALLLGALALPQVYRLGGAIRETLYRNYVSIEAAQHMQAALDAAQLAEPDGTLAQTLPRSRNEFMHWIEVEENDITEVGEAELAKDIHNRAGKLFDDFSAARPGSRHDEEFDALRMRLNKLIELNRDAMFRADSRASRIGARVTTEFAVGLAVLLVFGLALSWTIAWEISKPLDDLADRLRSFSLREPHMRLGEQKLQELQTVASEFNRMAERLEQFDRLNVDRIIYEKNKTEAIIESLEDGVVLIDPKGVVTHINEIAAIILGVDRADALGSPFDDLNSNHPHYLRVRSALARAVGAAADGQRIEVEMHVRGRAHTYVLKPLPLVHAEGRALGTILILQDVTHLRDQDRARINLVATLSPELKTPLTSLALSAELLARQADNLEPRQRQLVAAINEDVARMRKLAENLLDLARGDLAVIAVERSDLDLGPLIDEVVKGYAIQAEAKHVRLEKHDVEAGLQMRGDPIKLSWVVSNLIGNALRYTSENGAVIVSAARNGGNVRLEVVDSGPGIAPEVRDSIFERFAQWSANGAPQGSAGLGLAIVKEIVEAHDGRIFVESSVGQGSKFIVEFPARSE